MAGDEKLIDLVSPTRLFEDTVKRAFGVDSVSKTELGIRFEHAFTIWNEDRADFTFCDADLRLSAFLVQIATLCSVLKSDRVVFFSPTTYYARQADDLHRRYERVLLDSTARAALPPPTYRTIVPERRETVDEALRTSGADSVFMHGRDWSDLLPTWWSGRKIVQMFSGESVPTDARPLSCFMCHERDD